MSDGPAPPASDANLDPHPVGVVIFAVVVNRATGVHDLTTEQIQAIYQGKFTNWKQVSPDAADLPISLVSRTSGSGTRRAFEMKVLKGGFEPQVSSYDCVHKNAVADSAVIRCEQNTTEQQLQQINQIQGAIGYAEASAAAIYPNVNLVQLDGSSPDIHRVQDKTYPYWAVEYFYTYGQSSPSVLRSAFLKYVDSEAAAKNILRRDGITPCVDGSQSLTASLCRQ